MSVTIDELKAGGIEVGDRVRLKRVKVYEGVLRAGLHDPTLALVSTGGRTVAPSVQATDEIELVEAAQPELVPGELYQPIAGDLKSYVYKYRGSGNFVAYVDGTGSLNFMGQSIVRSLGELGRVKRVKLQVVDA